MEEETCWDGRDESALIDELKKLRAKGDGVSDCKSLQRVLLQSRNVSASIVRRIWVEGEAVKEKRERLMRFEGVGLKSELIGFIDMDELKYLGED